MRRIREVLRLKHECGLSHRGISASTGMSKGSVSDYLRRAEEAGLTWEQARELDDGALEARLFINVGQNLPPTRAPIDHRWVHTELQKRGVSRDGQVDPGRDGQADPGDWGWCGGRIRFVGQEGSGRASGSIGSAGLVRGRGRDGQADPLAASGWRRRDRGFR